MVTVLPGRVEAVVLEPLMVLEVVDPAFKVVVVRRVVVAVRPLVLGADAESLGIVLVSGGPSRTVKRPSARLPGVPVRRTR